MRAASRCANRRDIRYFNMLQAQWRTDFLSRLHDQWASVTAWLPKSADHFFDDVFAVAAYPVRSATLIIIAAASIHSIHLSSYSSRYQPMANFTGSFLRIQKSRPWSFSFLLNFGLLLFMLFIRCTRHNPHKYTSAISLRAPHVWESRRNQTILCFRRV